MIQHTQPVGLRTVISAHPSLPVLIVINEFPDMFLANFSACYFFFFSYQPCIQVFDLASSKTGLALFVGEGTGSMLL